MKNMVFHIFMSHNTPYNAPYLKKLKKYIGYTVPLLDTMKINSATGREF